MLIRDLKTLVFAQLILSTALIVGSFIIWQKPFPDLAARAIPNWFPEAEVVTLTENPDNSISQLNQALTRPVFRMSRRPFDPAQLAATSQLAPILPDQQIAIAPQQPPPDISQLSLKGISINHSKNLVLISSAETPDGAWLTLGDLVSGWKITAIDKNSVLLMFGSQKVVLSLYLDNL